MKSSDTHIVEKYQLREEPERLFSVAGMYWRTMLTIDIFIFILAFVAGAYMLVITFLDMNVSGAQSGAVQTINNKDLANVVKNFNSRKDNFQKIQQTPLQVVDPSK